MMRAIAYAAGAALLLAGAASANPRNFARDRCPRRYAFGLEAQHRAAHHEAVRRDRINHQLCAKYPRKLRERHRQIRAYLNSRHLWLARREAELRARRRPASPYPVYTPPRRPAPGPPPHGRNDHEYEHPGKAKGHDKPHPPGKAKGHDKPHPPGKAKGHERD